MGKNWESTTLLTLLTDVLASFSNFPVLQIIYTSFEAELFTYLIEINLVHQLDVS